MAFVIDRRHTLGCIFAVWAARVGAHSDEPDLRLMISDSGYFPPQALEALRAHKAWQGKPPWQREFAADDLLSETPPPDILVTLGAAAMERMHVQLQSVPQWRNTAWLATWLPKASMLNMSAISRERFGAVWLDQPVRRYLSLVTKIFPRGARVGVLLGEHSLLWKTELEAAVDVKKLDLRISSVLAKDPISIMPYFARLLDSVDVVLLLPDAGIVNRITLPQMLVGAYRRRIPVISYAASHVKAGAAMSLYSSHDDMAETVVSSIKHVMVGRRFSLKMADKCSVVVNEQVIRSLNLPLFSPDDLTVAILEDVR